jgi:hypothetical protein
MDSTPPYAGPWRRLPGDRLEQHPRLALGDLLVLRSGAVMLRCPACGTLQFIVATCTGDPEQPSLDSATTCAARDCRTKRCACRWTVVNGVTRLEVAAPPPPPAPRISPALVAAGVRPPLRR